MRYYIIAGERSGDLHGGNLIHALRRQDPGAVIRGFGGEDMQAAGAELAVHYNQLAFMGFITLLANYGTIRRMLKFCKDDILAFQPDVVILIDYGGFNRRIAKFTKPRGIRTFYYIPPKVWAWYQRRATELKRTIDRMFVILPFEKEFYKRYGMEVDYVGNPVLDAVKAFVPDDTFCTRHSLDKQQPIVALLPGSRRMELKRMIPVMAELIGRYPDVQFAVAAVSSLDGRLYEPLRSHSRVKFVLDDTYNLLRVSTAAVVTSGTATLETALFRVPQVCVYKAGWLEMKIGKAVVQVKYISLVNLIAGRGVIRELIQEDASIEAIAAELRQIIQPGDYRTTMLAAYEEIRKILDTGSASDNAARRMIGYLES